MFVHVLVLYNVRLTNAYKICTKVQLHLHDSFIRTYPISYTSCEFSFGKFLCGRHDSLVTSHFHRHKVHLGSAVIGMEGQKCSPLSS